MSLTATANPIMKKSKTKQLIINGTLSRAVV